MVKVGGVMIKVVAFDLVGVLVHEKDVELTEVEERLERMFGDNIDDSTYMLEAKRLCKGVSIKSVTEELMRKLYQVGDKNLFKKLKKISSCETCYCYESCFLCKKIYCRVV